MRNSRGRVDWPAVEVQLDDGTWVAGRLGSTLVVEGQWEGQVVYRCPVDGVLVDGWFDRDRLRYVSPEPPGPPSPGS